VKKLLALLGVGGLFLVFVAGCPSTTTAPPSTTTPKPTATSTSSEKPEKKHEGKFVSYKDGELKYKDDKDKEQSFKTDVKPMINDKDGKWDDVKPDATITITEKEGKVTKVDVKEKKEVATPKVETHEGKFGSLKDDKLTIKDKEGKEHEFSVKDVKDVPKEDELKKAEKITVTTTDGKVTKVEAK